MAPSAVISSSAALAHELPPRLDALDVFERLCALPGCVFFDSALRHETLGRYSYVAADPFAWLMCGPTEDGISRVAAALAQYPCETIAGLPPFQGGAAGLFGYDLSRSLERVPAARYDDLPAPAMAVGLYDVVFAFDHASGRAWVISQGLPATHAGERARRAEERMNAMLEWAQSPPRPFARPQPAPLSYEALAPQYGVDERSGVTSNFSHEAYLQAVTRAVEHIQAGDVFQVNLSQRLLAPLATSAVEYYRRLRARSPAPYGGYFDTGDVQLCSASPELFLRVRDRRVETRPIKGTRPRGRSPEEDRRLAEQLLASEKDRAENTMIVDLLRNDLSRVSTDESVVVPRLCGLESYADVHHLVSVVESRLRPDAGPLDLLRAAFPGGSITGAPKVRAMQLIAELEPTARGPYCGSLAYIGFNGAMDSSILIRTAVATRGWLQMPVGGGVVADSDPAAEYEETLQKAAGMLGALGP